jgi:hypothetical protein
MTNFGPTWSSTETIAAKGTRRPLPDITSNNGRRLALGEKQNVLGWLERRSTHRVTVEHR